MKALEYKDWKNFQNVIDKSVISAQNSISFQANWVVEVNKPIKTGKGKKVRNAILDIGGIMPEDMPTPEKSLKVLEKEKIKSEITIK